MISDGYFVSDYMEQNHKALTRRHAAFWEAVDRSGLPVPTMLQSEAGLFVWLNLRGFLAEVHPALQP